MHLNYILHIFQARTMSGRSDPARFDSRSSVIFSLKNQVGGLARALQVFQVSVLTILSNILILTIKVLKSYPIIFFLQLYNI